MEAVIKRHVSWLRVFENYPLEGHGTDLVKRFTADIIEFRKLLNSKKYTSSVKWKILRVYQRLYNTYHKFVKIDALYARGTEARDFEPNPETSPSALFGPIVPSNGGQTVE
jgi:hypothetical protein